MIARRFVPLIATVLSLTAIGVGAIVGLEIANRPVAAIVYLMSAVIVPTIPALLALQGVNRANYTLENGLKDQIAERVRLDALEVAQQLAKDLAARQPPMR